MQVRFDGHLGFPGGIIDPGESPEEALLRELTEELDIPSTIVFDADDRLFIHYNKTKSLILHFFVKEVSSELFRTIELRSTKSLEYGNEVLGVLRVPLYTMCDGYRGFPAFLQNKFIGNSKQQLIESLKLLNIMTSDEIEKAKNAKPPYGPSSMKMDLLAENNYAKKHENDTFS
ncbi:U8 snoRNA-decapping enzyme-like isoform X2 [Rhodnius prolixus]